jgi:predicted nucleic acid-binding protein
MALTHLLDTSILSQPIKDHPLSAVMDRWSAQGDAAICTSAICVAEILQGLELRKSKKYWHRYRELVENRYPTLPFDQTVATVFGKTVAALRSQGKPRPVVDLFIACTAKRHGLIIATLNSKDFLGIPGLQVEDWSGSK